MIEIRPGRRINISVYKKQDKSPTLFLFHGLGGRKEHWREQIKYFQDKFTLIVPDLLGHGDSEKPKPHHNNPYSFQELSKDIQAIFDRFAGDINYVCGHSYGGALSTFLAKDNQTRIQKLALLTPLSCKPSMEMPVLYMLPVPLLEVLRTYLDTSFEKLAFAASDDPNLLMQEKTARKLNPMYVIKSLLIGLKNIPRVDITQLLIPSLIIGGRQDKLIPTIGIKKFYTRLPNHQFFIVDNAAHMVMLEQSAKINQLLDEFLKSN